MKTISWGCITFLAFIVTGFLGISVTKVEAALIQSISFKGGGCDMSENSGTCTNASANFIDEFTVSVTKNFNKTEGEDEGEGGCDHKNGKCSGKCGSSKGGGHEEDGETHEHELDFEKLAPIHMFITLTNSGNPETYFFTEDIFNGMNINWDGFYFALKQNEDDRALFVNRSSLDYNYFEAVDAKGKKLTFSEGSYSSGSPIPLEFGFSITFFDVDDEVLKDIDATFSVLLQEFPLINAPVPEPSTMLLFGAGLIGLAGATRRKLKK